MGEAHGERRDSDRGNASDAPLVDPAGASAENLFSTSGHVSGGDTTGHASDLGQLLLATDDLAPRPRREVDQGTPCVCADLEALSPDVREHRDRHRQRTRSAVAALGTLDGETLPKAVYGQTDAGVAGALRSVGWSCSSPAAALSSSGSA